MNLIVILYSICEGHPGCNGSIEHEGGIQLRFRGSSPQGPGIFELLFMFTLEIYFESKILNDIGISEMKRNKTNG
jgi:hypothetical protein